MATNVGHVKVDIQLPQTAERGMKTSRTIAPIQ
jgi:hypothetical protein